MALSSFTANEKFVQEGRNEYGNKTRRRLVRRKVSFTDGDDLAARAVADGAAGRNSGYADNFNLKQLLHGIPVASSASTIAIQAVPGQLRTNSRGDLWVISGVWGGAILAASATNLNKQLHIIGIT